MPEHLRALVVILALASVVFLFAKAPACAVAMRSADFERRRNAWLAITLAAFLAHNFWVFIIAAGAVLIFALPREPNKLAMFFFLLFAVPAFPAQITGFGVIQHFFTVHYLRVLSLAILLPAFLSLRAQPDVERFGRTLPDKLIAGYLVLNFLLMLTANTFTNTLRHGMFYAFIDIFLPYYVASRYLKNLQAFRDALMAFVVAALVLSAIGAFEFAKGWLLYTSLETPLQQPSAFTGYLMRDDSLRARGSVGHPIVFGFVMAVALALFLYLRKFVASSNAWGLGLIVLIVGLAVSLSRGPWVGAAVILLVFIVTGPSPARWLLALGLVGAIIAPILLLTAEGQKIIDYLPFVGNIEVENISYRQRLLEVSIQVIWQKPFFGAFDFVYSPAMQELRQGQGIIDIVNTYLGVGLSSGIVGLSFFLGFFVVIAVNILRATKKVADRSSEFHLLGRVLFAALLGIMIIIFTVSSVWVIPIIYWSIAGLGVAYAQLPPVGASERAMPTSYLYRAVDAKGST